MHWMDLHSSFLRQTLDKAFMSALLLNFISGVNHAPSIMLNVTTRRECHCHPCHAPRPNPTATHAQTDRKADDTEQVVVVLSSLPEMGDRGDPSENDSRDSKKPPSAVTWAFAAETLEVATSPVARQWLNQLSLAAKAKQSQGHRGRGGRKLARGSRRARSRALYLLARARPHSHSHKGQRPFPGNWPCR